MVFDALYFSTVAVIRHHETKDNGRSANTALHEFLVKNSQTKFQEDISMHLDGNDDNEERAVFGMINKATDRAVSKKLREEKREKNIRARTKTDPQGP